MKFKYIEISIIEYMMTKQEQMDKMKKKIRKNIDNHIKKNSKKKNVDGVISATIPVNILVQRK